MFDQTNRVKAPDGQLLDVSSQSPVMLRSAAGAKGTVVVFLCNHCPFVNHIIDEVVNLARLYIAQAINFVAISPSDINQFPDDAPERMRQYAEECRFPFPYLYDENQAISRAFGAMCTPDFYVLDSQWSYFYHGQFDHARPANTIPVTGEDLKNAVESLLNGLPLSSKPHSSVGCPIRWKM